MTEQEWLNSSDPSAMLAYLTGPNSTVRGVQAYNATKPPVRLSERKFRLFAAALCRQVWDKLDTRGKAAVEFAEQFADGEGDDRTRADHERADHFALATEACIEATRGSPIEEHALADATRVAVMRKQIIAEHVGTSKDFGLLVPPAMQANLLRDICGNPWKPATCGWRTVRAAKDMSNRALESGASEEAVWFGDWQITREVLALAQAAYSTPRRVKCERCNGEGGFKTYKGHGDYDEWGCEDCETTGYTSNGLLDADRMAVLADAAEDSGCADQAILAHLRGLTPCTCLYGYGAPPNTPQCRDGWLKKEVPCVRGCAVLDLILGKS